MFSIGKIIASVHNILSPSKTMSNSESMDTFAARLASFDVAHPATKRRTSNAKGAKTLKWPHQNPSASAVSSMPTARTRADEQLAYAGFFYQPTSTSPDKATCFTCGSGVDGWDSDDDPVTEHLALCPYCSWAITLNVERQIEAGSGELEDPTSEKMLQAREGTFGKKWPHDSKRGWVCKSQKVCSNFEMTSRRIEAKCPRWPKQAGTTVQPQRAMILSNVPTVAWDSMDGNQRTNHCECSLVFGYLTDEKSEEHQKRTPGCAFFTMATGKVAKGAKAKKSRASKASRLSTQSIATAVDDHNMDLGLEEGNSNMTIATDAAIASTAAKAKRPTKAKKGKGKAASKTAKAKVTEELASSFIEPEDDDFAVKVDVPLIKETRGKKRKSAVMEHDAEDQVAAPPKRRATRTRSSVIQLDPQAEPITADFDVVMIDAEEAFEPASLASKTRKQSGRKRSSSTTRKASIMSTASKASLRLAIPADDEIDAALELDLDRPLTDDEVVNVDDVQPTKGRRNTRSKLAPRTSKASMARVRKATRESAMEATQTYDTEAENPRSVIDQESCSSLVEDTVKPIKSKKIRPGQKQSDTAKASMDDMAETTDEATLVPSAEESVAPKVQHHLRDLTPELDPPKKKAARSRKPSRQINPLTIGASELPTSQGMTSNEISATNKQDTQDVDVTQVIPAPVQSKPVKKPRVASKKLPSSRIVSSSTQNGNTVLPSSDTITATTTTTTTELSNTDPISHMQLLPAAAFTGAADTHAPTHAPRTGLSSPTPSPQASDAENQAPSQRPARTRPPLLAGSPSPARTPLSTPRARATGLRTTFAWTSADVERAVCGTPHAGADDEDKENACGPDLTSAEQAMTVEEWIARNAEREAEALRMECERVVGRFESEGVRALKSLEGIVCVEEMR